MTTVHAFLHRDHEDIDPVDTVIYRPSTFNQVSVNTKRVLSIYFSIRQNENWRLENLIAVLVSFFLKLYC